VRKIPNAKVAFALVVLRSTKYDQDTTKYKKLKLLELGAPTVVRHWNGLGAFAPPGIPVVVPGINTNSSE
jgi:hypothetical protein